MPTGISKRVGINYKFLKMKKKKLSLDALKVKSFVTSFDKKDEDAIRGGACSSCPDSTHWYNETTFKI